jgi:PIN domain nuclease of toxin-antitoxin system
MLLLDSHVLVWLAADHPRLGARAGRAIDRALAADGVAVSSFSYWEIETLLLRKRIRGISSTDELREQAVALGLAEIEIDGSIAIAAARLRAFHGDPADRIIVATAQLNESTLVTADEALLDWGSALRTLDASR